MIKNNNNKQGFIERQTQSSLEALYNNGNETNTILQRELLNQKQIHMNF